MTKQLSYSRYVGRVGTLAVALGVGVAIAPTAAESVMPSPREKVQVVASAPTVVPVQSAPRSAEFSLTVAGSQSPTPFDASMSDESAYSPTVLGTSMPPVAVHHGRSAVYDQRDTALFFTPVRTALASTEPNRRGPAVGAATDGDLAIAVPQSVSALQPGPGGDLISAFISNGDEPGENGGLLIGNGADGGPGQNGGRGGLLF